MPKNRKLSASGKEFLNSKYKVNEADREMVVMLKMNGNQADVIAKVLGVTVPTLTKYYDDEMKTGEKKVLGKIAGNVVRMALGSPGDASKNIPPVPPDRTAAFFVLKCRAGWKENDSLDINGKLEIVKRVIGVDEKDV